MNPLQILQELQRLISIYNHEIYVLRTMQETWNSTSPQDPSCDPGLQAEQEEVVDKSWKAITDFMRSFTGVKELEEELKMYKDYTGGEIYMSDFQNAGQMRKALVTTRAEKAALIDTIKTHVLTPENIKCWFQILVGKGEKAFLEDVDKTLTNNTF